MVIWKIIYSNQRRQADITIKHKWAISGLKWEKSIKAMEAWEVRRLVFIFQDRGINKKKNTTGKVLLALSALMHFSSSPWFKPTLGAHFAVPHNSTYVESIRASGQPHFRRTMGISIHFNAINRTQLPKLPTITGFSRGFLQSVLLAGEVARSDWAALQFGGFGLPAQAG